MSVAKHSKTESLSTGTTESSDPEPPPPLLSMQEIEAAAAARNMHLTVSSVGPVLNLTVYTTLPSSTSGSGDRQTSASDGGGQGRDSFERYSQFFGENVKAVEGQREGAERGEEEERGSRGEGGRGRGEEEAEENNEPQDSSVPASIPPSPSSSSRSPAPAMVVVGRARSFIRPEWRAGRLQWLLQLDVRQIAPQRRVRLR